MNTGSTKLGQQGYYKTCNFLQNETGFWSLQQLKSLEAGWDKTDMKRLTSTKVPDTSW